MTTPEYSQIVAKEIKKLRISKKISVQELSIISNVSTSTISKIETGNYNFNIYTLWKLCKAFNIEPYSLIKKAEEKSTP